MFDTKGIRIEKPMDEVIKNMKASITVKKKNGELGKYSSEKWCIWEQDNQTFIQFSLTKFVCGNNLKNVRFINLINSLKYVIRIINQPPSQLLLYRVDLAYNIILPKEIKYYMSELNELRNFTVSTYNNNISRKYYGRSINVLLYDKLKEMFRKKIPKELLHLQNRILRFEVQFLKALKKLINFSRYLTLDDLSNPEIIKLFLEQWLTHYQKLTFDRTIQTPFILSPEKITTAGLFEKYFAYVGLDKIGFDNVNYFLTNEITDSGKRSRMRKKMSEIRSDWRNHFGNTSLSKISDIDLRIQKGYDKRLEEINNL